MGHDSACISVANNVADTMGSVQIRLANKEEEQLRYDQGID